MNGILLINKPKGITSHDVVSYLRHRSGIRRIGHIGTLDPMASGVLVMLFGKATRLAEYLTNFNKSYEASITLGAISDTYDAEGQITPQKHLPPIKSKVIAVLNNFKGQQNQMPPMFSAIKIKGRKAYELAREGKVFDLKPREVTINSLEIISYKYPLITIKTNVSSGTYIRSLAHDIGQAFKTGAYLCALERTSVGPFKLKQCYEINKITKTNLSSKFIPPEKALKDMKKLALNESELIDIRYGRSIQTCLAFTDQEKIAGMYHNSLVAILEFRKNEKQVKPVKVL